MKSKTKLTTVSIEDLTAAAECIILMLDAEDFTDGQLPGAQSWRKALRSIKALIAADSAATTDPVLVALALEGAADVLQGLAETDPFDRHWKTKAPLQCHFCGTIYVDHASVDDQHRSDCLWWEAKIAVDPPIRVGQQYTWRAGEDREDWSLVEVVDITHSHPRMIGTKARVTMAGGVIDGWEDAEIDWSPEDHFSAMAELWA